MLPYMSGTLLQDLELLFPSAGSRPRSIVVIGATGKVGFGKLCQIADRLLRLEAFDIPLVALDPSSALPLIKDKLQQRLCKTHDATQVAKFLACITFIQGTVEALPTGLDIGWALEAVPEDLSLKKSVYQSLLGREHAPALLASTTSAYTSQALFGEYPDKGRCAVMHPFFPHHKNPLWELACKGAVTSPNTMRQIRALMQALSLELIEVADVPAFAADRVFCGLMLHAVRACEDFNLSPLAFDEISQTLLGCAPFRVHNMIPGSNALSMHCMQLCHDEVPSTLYAIPKSWTPYKDDPSIAWPMEGKVNLDPETSAKVRERIVGALGCICAYMLEHEIVSPAALDKLCTQALAFRKGPCALFREIGISELQRTTSNFVASAEITLAERVWPMQALDKLGK